MSEKTAYTTDWKLKELMLVGHTRLARYAFMLQRWFDVSRYQLYYNTWSSVSPDPVLTKIEEMLFSGDMSGDEYRGARIALKMVDHEYRKQQVDRLKYKVEQQQKLKMFKEDNGS